MSARCAPRAAAASAARAKISGVVSSRPTAFAAASSASRRPKLFAAAVEADTTAPEPAAPAAAAFEAKEEEETVVITEAGRLANAEPERRRGGNSGGRGGGRGRGRRTPTLKTEDIVAGLQIDGKVVRGLFSLVLRHSRSNASSLPRRLGRRRERERGESERTRREVRFS